MDSLVLVKNQKGELFVIPSAKLYVMNDNIVLPMTQADKGSLIWRSGSQANRNVEFVDSGNDKNKLLLDHKDSTARIRIVKRYSFAKTPMKAQKKSTSSSNRSKVKTPQKRIIEKKNAAAERKHEQKCRSLVNNEGANFYRELMASSGDEIPKNPDDEPHISNNSDSSAVSHQDSDAAPEDLTMSGEPPSRTPATSRQPYPTPSTSHNLAHIPWEGQLLSPIQSRRSRSVSPSQRSTPIREESPRRPATEDQLINESIVSRKLDQLTTLFEQQRRDLMTLKTSLNQHINGNNSCSDIPNVRRKSRTPHMLDDKEVEINGTVIDIDNYLRAVQAKTMKQRAYAIMRAIWPVRTRLELGVAYDKKHPSRRIIRSKTYIQLINMCLALQNTKDLGENGDKIAVSEMREWTIEFLKYEKSKHAQGEKN